MNPVPRDLPGLGSQTEFGTQDQSRYRPSPKRSLGARASSHPARSQTLFGNARGLLGVALFLLAALPCFAQRRVMFPPAESPPPPTTLTVMYKLQYGETLEYQYPDGTVQKFEQWKSYPSDAYNLVSQTNTRLADGNNYQYAEKPLASGPFDPVDIPILVMTGDYDFAFTPQGDRGLTQGSGCGRGRPDPKRAL